MNTVGKSHETGENMANETDESSQMGESKSDPTENLPVPVDEFALTKALRAINGKLRDGIAGVIQRTYRVSKAFIIFIKDLIVRFVVDGFPFIFRLIWHLLKFIFGRKMINLVKEHIFLVILFPVFLLAIAWPLAVYCVTDEGFWLWIGLVWLFFIGLAGAWLGFKKGLYSKWIKIVKTRRANKKAARASAGKMDAKVRAVASEQDQKKN